MIHGTVKRESLASVVPGLVSPLRWGALEEGGCGEDV